MKTLVKYLLITVLNTSVISMFAQEVIVQHYQPDQFVFWITVRAQVKISNETKKEVYVVRTARHKPQSGKLYNYEKSLWKNLNSGRQLLVGPFTEYQDAVRAAEMYDIARHTNESMAEHIRTYTDSTAAPEYYWFFLKYKIMPRTKKLALERTAARVAYGDIKDFMQVLWEGLTFKQLAIGPFQSQVEAEEAKRLYRLEED